MQQIREHRPWLLLAVLLVADPNVVLNVRRVGVVLAQLDHPPVHLLRQGPGIM